MKTFATNPFPGMNPWLEAYWGDIHSALTLYARDAIDRTLPGGLQARVEEYLAIEGPIEYDRSGRRIAPDITIYDSRSSGVTVSPRGVAILEGAEPVVIQRQAEPMTQGSGLLQRTKVAIPNRLLNRIAFASREPPHRINRKCTVRPMLFCCQAFVSR